MSEDYTKLRRMLKKTRTKNDPKLGHKKPSKKNIHAYNGRIKILLLLNRAINHAHQKPNLMKRITHAIKRAIHE